MIIASGNHARASRSALGTRKRSPTVLQHQDSLASPATAAPVEMTMSPTATRPPCRPTKPETTISTKVEVAPATSTMQTKVVGATPSIRRPSQSPPPSSTGQTINKESLLTPFPPCVRVEQRALLERVDEASTRTNDILLKTITCIVGDGNSNNYTSPGSRSAAKTASTTESSKASSERNRDMAFEALDPVLLPLLLVTNELPATVKILRHLITWDVIRPTSCIDRGRLEKHDVTSGVARVPASEGKDLVIKFRQACLELNFELTRLATEHGNQSLVSKGVADGMQPTRWEDVEDLLLKSTAPTSKDDEHHQQSEGGKRDAKLRKPAPTMKSKTHANKVVGKGTKAGSNSDDAQEMWRVKREINSLFPLEHEMRRAVEGLESALRELTGVRVQAMKAQVATIEKAWRADCRGQKGGMEMNVLLHPGWGV